MEVLCRALASHRYDSDAITGTNHPPPAGSRDDARWGVRNEEDLLVCLCLPLAHSEGMNRQGTKTRRAVTWVCGYRGPSTHQHAIRHA